MKIRLDRYDIAMVNATTKESSRPMLNNICLRDGNLAAADGFMLVVREADIKDGKHEGETLLPATIVKTIRSTPKRQAELELDGENLSVRYKDETEQPVEFDPTLSFKSYTDSRGFPAYDSLFPESTEKKAQIAVRVGLLRQLVSCLPDNGILRIGVNEPDQPIEFECASLDRPIRGMLMPMFIDWKDFNWHRAKPGKPKAKE